MIVEEAVVTPTVVELYEAAMRACRHWKDGPAARAEMRKACIEVPSDQRAELIAHFVKAYPEKEKPAEVGLPSQL